MPSIAPLTPRDRAAVLAIAGGSGLFDDEGVALIADRLDQHYAGNGELWLASSDAERVGGRVGEHDAGRDGEPAGVLYCVPEAMTDGTWNVLMLVVRADAHGGGHGRALLGHVETLLASRGARLLIVETSSGDGLERARGFYPQYGFTEEARIRDFYAAGADKIVFSKAIAG